MNEKIVCHALNVFYKGDYSKLQKVSASFDSWGKAWDAVGKKSGVDLNEVWEILIEKRINFSLRTDSDFPEILKEIPWPPFGIYWKGAPISRAVKIGIVGTRKATANGKAVAEKFAQKIAEAGCEVVSGLALGIDTAAHNGALAGKGITIAVLAGGLDYIYPKQNERLAEKIINSGGTLISEYAFGAPVYSSRFLERNRIISGLSKGVLVVEAPEGSGALATAKFAVDQNRDVFVVPGGLSQPNYTGSHGLIKAGAALVTDPDEILEDLGLVSPEKNKSAANRSLLNLESLDENQRTVIKTIQSAGDPLSVDKIQELAKMDISSVNRAVSLLTIRGIIKEERGKYSI